MTVDATVLLSLIGTVLITVRVIMKYSAKRRPAR
jgi:hypothetical protein